MAKFPNELAEIIWNLKRQLLDIVDAATAAEFTLFELFGETSDTTPFLDELKSVAERATPWFSRLSNFQLRINCSAFKLHSQNLIKFLWGGRLARTKNAI